MVTTLDLPLDGPQQAVVNFLIGIALGRIKKNSPKSLLHDVHGASKLIKWIVLNGFLKNRSLRIASTLVLGNTFVLREKARRLCEDTDQAVNSIKRYNFLALEAEEKKKEEEEEEERKKRSAEQMMEVDQEDDDDKTPKKKKKKRSNGVPPFTARHQDITLPVEAIPWRDEFLVFDDLEIPNEQDYREFSQMTNPGNDTFVDQHAAAALEDVRQMAPVRQMTPELERPPSRNNYPVAQDDYFFEPLHNEPRHNEPRASMDREMDDERIRGLQNLLDENIVVPPPEPEPEPARIEPEPARIEPEPPRTEPEPARIEPEPPRTEPELLRIEPEPPRIEPEPPRIEPEPPSTPRAPRASRAPRAPRASRAPRAPRAARAPRFQITEAEKKKQMKDYSELHYKESDRLIVNIAMFEKEQKRIKKRMTLEQLLSSVPYSMRKPAHKELAEQFPPEPEFIGEEEEEEPRQIHYRDLPPIDLGDPEPVAVASPMYPPTQNPANDGEEEEPRQLLAPIDLEDLEAEARAPIDLEELDLEPVAVASPMNFPHQSPARDEEEEEPRQIFLEDLEPVAVASPTHPPPQRPQYFDFEDVVLEHGPVHDFEDVLEHEPADDPFNDRLRSKDQIRKDLLVECKNVYPSSYQLDRKMKVGKTTPREAAGTFYAALVLLKNQAIEAKQETPFGPIDLTFTGNGSDDLDEMANDEDEENGLGVANDVEAMEIDNGNTPLNNL